MSNGESEYYFKIPTELNLSKDERLLNIINNTGTLKLFDYISLLIIGREADRGEDESTEALLDHLIEKRERVIEIASLKRMLSLPSGASAREEEINEALFKPFGE